MRVIGLDLGSLCGFAWTDDGKPHVEQSGVMNFHLRHYEGGGLRLLRFENFLSELLRHEGSCLVYFEEVIWRPGRGDTIGKGDLGAGAVIYGELSGALMTTCERMAVPFEGFKPGEIKKAATGKGNANKQMMVEAAQKAYGPAVDSDDQADALHILALGLDRLGFGGNPGLPGIGNQAPR